MWFKRECKADFATKIISSEHPQPDYQQTPVKNRTDTIPVQRCLLNVRGFKRYGSALHLQRRSPYAPVDFEGNAMSGNGKRYFLEKPGAETDMNVATPA